MVGLKKMSLIPLVGLLTIQIREVWDITSTEGVCSRRCKHDKDSQYQDKRSKLWQRHERRRMEVERARRTKWVLVLISDKQPISVNANIFLLGTI